MSEEEEFEFRLRLEQEEAQAAPSAPVADKRPAPEGMRGSKLDAFLTGLRDPIDAMAQWAPRMASGYLSTGGLNPNAMSRFFDDQAARVDQLVQGNETEYQAAREAQGREGIDAMRIGGAIASPVNLAGGAGAANLMKGLNGWQKVLASVPTGASLGALQPALQEGEDFGGQKAEQAVLGGVVGPASQVGANVVSGVIAPKLADGARELLNQGIRLTPGQMLGGLTRRAEEGATSLPIIGDAIRGAKTRGFEDFNKAVANRALAPIGQTVAKGVEAGRDLVSGTKKALSDAYNKLLPNIQFKPDQQFAQEMQQLVQMTRSAAFVRGEQFEAIVRDKLISKMTPQGLMNGESFKRVEEGLGKEAKKYLASADADQRDLGEALRQVLASARGALVRVNPNHAAELKAINQGYANFARMRQAAASVGTDEGVFTPAQLQNAVKAGDSSVGKGQFAEGKALMQDLSDPAKSILPSKLPDSGTTERALLNALTLGGGATMAPALLAKLLIGAGSYTQPGQYVLRHAIASRPQSASALAKAVAEHGQVAVPGILPLLPIGKD